MGSESLPGYGPGYSIMKDRYGNLVDEASSLTERYCLTGQTWRIDTGYVSLSADGSYTLVSFKTPVSGRCFYGFADLDKSGVEVVKSLIRGGTVTGDTTKECYNYDDDIDADTCPLQSHTAGGTITGGTERFLSMAPGTGNPATKQGGNSRGQGFVVLQKNTLYSLKIMAKGGAATVAANVGIVYISGAE